MDVAEIGSYYVGGRTVTLRDLPERDSFFSKDPNGEIAIEAMYVQYIRLNEPRGKVPLLLWHGGGLTGSTYETKPDGAPGWQNYFLGQGWDVYLSDAVERGRSGWAPFPHVWKAEPFFRIKKDSWERFRVGPAGSYDPDPAKRIAFPGIQFPVEAFDEFAKYGVPRWDSNHGATQVAYDLLVQRVGPCAILAHSQGALFAYKAALNAPNRVKAVVIDEGGPEPYVETADLSVIKDTPFLFLFGDYIEESPHWQYMREFARKFADRLRAAGGSADIYELPEMGIHGNSHMNMMERNSDEIAGLIQSWLASKGLVR